MDRFYLSCENGAGFFGQTGLQRLQQSALHWSEPSVATQSLE
jgi:hypothetical protein